jgi:hypothetical protein
MTTPKLDALGDHVPYWARPPSRAIGDTDIRVTFAAVGDALSSWEMFEFVLSWLFMHMVEARTQAMERAYGSISAAGGRKTALKAAADAYFPRYGVTAVDVARFNKLMNHMELAVGRRNEIAHGMVFALLVDPEREHSGVTHFLGPAAYGAKGNKPRKTIDMNAPLIERLPGLYRYTAADIEAFRDGFRALLEATGEYLEHLKITYTSPRP